MASSMTRRSFAWVLSAVLSWAIGASPGAAKEPDPSVPSWMIDGLLAASQDGLAMRGLAELSSLPWLLSGLPRDDYSQSIISAFVEDGQAELHEIVARLQPEQVTPELVATLLTHLNSDNGQDDEVRSRAAKALGRIPGPRITSNVISALLTALGDNEPRVVQEGVAYALSHFPKDKMTPEIVAAIVQCLSQKASYGDNLRRSAADAAANVPDTLVTSELVSKLLQIIHSPSETDEDRSFAVKPLFRHSDALEPPVIASLLELLKLLKGAQKQGEQEVWRTRRAVIVQLGELPVQKVTADIISTLRDHLDPVNEEDIIVPIYAATALAKLAPAEPGIIPTLQALVSSKASDTAIISLARLPDSLWTPDVAAFTLNAIERSDSLASLVDSIPPNRVTSDIVPLLVRRLNSGDRQEQWQVTESLVFIPEEFLTPNVAHALFDQLSNPDEDESVRRSAIWALSRLPESALKSIPPEAITANFLEVYGPENGGPDLTGLRFGAAIDSLAVLEILEQRWMAGHKFHEEYLAYAYVLSGGNPDARMILSLFGGGHPDPIEPLVGNPDSALATLALLSKHWEAFPVTGPLRNDAEDIVGRIAEAACRSIAVAEGENVLGTLAADAWSFLVRLPTDGPVQRCWRDDQVPVIEALRDKLRKNGPSAALMTQQLRNDALAPFWQRTLWIVAGWTTFWAVFLFVFPWSSTVQAAFLFNPKLRPILSLGLVPFLLFVIPPLRRRLLEPFRANLCAEARLHDLEALKFFSQGRARKGKEEPQPLEVVMSRARGVTVVRGEAGLGKTCVLRWVASQCREPIAFLHARDCKDGVLEAIVRLMKGVQDTEFVHGMVHAGVLTIIIDGLNEVSAATREKINALLSSNSKARIFVSTQPIEWEPPATATIVDLLPLTRSEAEAFLLSRPVGSDPTQRTHGDSYVAAVREFLVRSLDQGPTLPEREAAALVLSNPFDLSFAADLIAQGVTPRAVALIDEAFRLADSGTGKADDNESYRARNGRPFPLKEFAQHAVKMRTSDRNWLDAGEFEPERSCLLKWRLLIRRAERKSDTEVAERERFRHDRVWDFFIAAAFAEDGDLLEDCLDDARFRGAYLRIADTWPTDAANAVRELLVDRAADTNDNTTSNEFVRRVKARLASSQRERQPEPA